MCLSMESRNQTVATLSLPTYVPARQLVVRRSHWRIGTVSFFTDRSKLDGKVGVYCQELSFNFSFRLSDYCSCFEAEVALYHQNETGRGFTLLVYSNTEQLATLFKIMFHQKKKNFFQEATIWTTLYIELQVYMRFLILILLILYLLFFILIYFYTVFVSLKTFRFYFHLLWSLHFFLRWLTIQSWSAMQSLQKN